MSEADGPIETSSPSTFGVFEQATRQGHSRVTTGWPISIELEKTQGGGFHPMLTMLFLTEETLIGRVWNMSRLKAFIFLRMDWITKGYASMTSLFCNDQIAQAARGKEVLQGIWGRYVVLEKVVDMSLSKSGRFRVRKLGEGLLSHPKPNTRICDYDRHANIKLKLDINNNQLNFYKSFPLSFHHCFFTSWYNLSLDIQNIYTVLKDWHNPPVIQIRNFTYYIS